MQGECLGPYRIDRELGSGGMGSVYEATLTKEAGELAAGTKVALKVVHPHLLETPGFFKRFLREAQVGQAIRHENVVRTLDCDQHFVDGRGQCFLAMEHVDGQTLAALLDEMDRLPEELCRHVGIEVCKGLVAIHDAGVVHRDLKPDNVLITPDHTVKIMDLGVALLVDEQLRLSQTGAFVGSVEYAAPEQFSGGEIEARTDLHALGVLLYELSSGVHPYRGNSYHDVVRRVCQGDATRLGHVCPQVSAFFEEVVHTLLVTDPRGRFASAAQLLEVLTNGERSAWWRGRSRHLREATRRPLRRVRIPRETAVYGRDGELDVLRSLYARAAAGEGQVVLVDGEAGIGKSRLIDELIGRLEADGADLNFLFGSYPPGGAASAAGAFSTAFREQLGEGGAAHYLADMPLLAPAFEALLRGDSVPTGAEPLTRQSMASCFVHVSRALAAERPTIVLIDDLHFAPEEARGLFTALATALAEQRLLLIGAQRPAAEEDWTAELLRLDHTTRLTVPRLGPKDLVHLLEDSLQSRHLAEELSAKIAVKSDGNPFFAFEIIRGLREGQFITRTADGTWVSTRAIDEIEIPSSVLDLVNARVVDLADDERDMLEVAACCGFHFDPLLVAEACDAEAIPALKAFGRIEKRHRLIRAAGRLYEFDHHQVQEALYQGLHDSLREHYHAALGEALARRHGADEREPGTLGGALCFDLCRHFLKGAQGAAALPFVRPAQEHLKESYLHAEYAALSEAALASEGLVEGADRARMLLGLTGVLDSLGRRGRQEECAIEAERVADASGDEEQREQAVREQARVLWRTSRFDEAEATYRRALDLSASRGDRSGEAEAHAGLGSVYQTMGRLPEAREHGERALAICRETGNRRLEAGVTMNLGNVSWAEGHLPRARELYERGRALHREVGNRAGEATATGNIGLTFSGERRIAEARAHDEEALALYRQIGDREGEARVTSYLGNLAYAEGRLTEARKLLHRALSLIVETGSKQGEASVILDLANILQDEGRHEESRERLERSLAISREIGYRRGESIATGNMGNVLLSLGRYSEAKEWYERHLELSVAMGDRAGEARATANLGTVAWTLGETTEAIPHYKRHVEIARETGNTASAAVILNSLGKLYREVGDRERAEECLTECLEICERIGDRRLEAAAHVALGALRAEAGEVDAGRASLERGRDACAEIDERMVHAIASCYLAGFTGGDVAAATAALGEVESRLDAQDRCRAHHLLWLATGDAAQLSEALSALDAWTEGAEDDAQRDRIRNMRIPREVLAARERQGDTRGENPDGPAGSDDSTRVR
jgi:serine/threonine protein kinase/tetratricopeptide (TPR) repeat protein